MIGDRETPPTDDIGVLWWGNGVRLAEEVKTFADDIRGLDLTPDQIADQLDELLTNPRPRLPDLGEPPLRRAVPALTLPAPFAEAVRRRAGEPGA